MELEERRRAFADEEDRLANRWRVFGGGALAAAVLLIGLMGGAGDAGVFVIPAVGVAYLLYLRDRRRLFKRFWNESRERSSN